MKWLETLEAVRIENKPHQKPLQKPTYEVAKA